MDNLESDHHGLQAEHGLSFWIETDGAGILFDFGNGSKTFLNAEKLCVDFSGLRFAVCSHSHYDHGGGFPALLAHASVPTLITGPGFFTPKYAFDGTKRTYLGAPFRQELLQKNHISHQICTDLYQLTEGCRAVGNFGRTCPLETVPSRFVRETPAGLEPDLFEDEICLTLQTEKGLAVVVGCSHPGIINILKTVQQRLNQPIYAVIGGTHLVEANEERIGYTVTEMKRMGIKLLALSHCSGKAAEQAIHADPEVTGCHLAVGESIVLQ